MKKVQIVIVILLLLCAPIRCVAVSYAPYGGMSEAPTIQMRSTSAWAGQRTDVRAAGIQNSGGFYTAASAVTGGITTYDSYNPEEGSRANGPRRISMPGVPDIFPTPIGDGWDVWIMLAVMAIVYAFFIRKRSVKSEA